jgi:hypothetical protein
VFGLSSAEFRVLVSPNILGAGEPEQTRDASRPLTVKLGLFVASDLADAFYSLYGISNQPNKEDIFKSQILTNYIYGVSINHPSGERDETNATNFLRLFLFSCLKEISWHCVEKSLKVASKFVNPIIRKNWQKKRSGIHPHSKTLW